MVETILNVVYDTRTAAYFGKRESKCEPPDPAWFEETLYRNQSGYWFIAGAGGSGSRFAVEYRAYGRLGSAGIIPIGRKQAMAWLAESNDHLDVLKKYFLDEKAYLREHYNIQI